MGFAATPTVWLYSIQGEVFALNNALMALLLMLTIRYYTKEERLQMSAATAALTKKSGEGQSVDANVASTPAASAAAPISSFSSSSSRSLVPLAFLGAFLCGLCLTNQHTTVFPVFVTAVWISWSLFWAGQLGPGRIVGLILCVLAGMSPYAYILVRSHWQVIDSWGDQRSLAGFLVHLLRSEYGTFQLASSEVSEEDPGMLARLAIYAQNLLSEATALTPLFALVGLGACLCSGSRAVRRATWAYLLSFLLYVAVFHKLANLDLRPLFLGVQARFWQQSNMYIWIWSGVGVQYTAEVAQKLIGSFGAKQTTNQSPAAPAPGASKPRLSFFLTLVYTSAFLLVRLSLLYPMHDHHANDSFYRSGAAMLEAFPPHSIVLLNGDLNNNLVKYPQQCEGLRPDLSLLSLQLMSWDWFVPMQRHNYPNVTFPGVRYHVSTARSFNIKKFLDANVLSARRKSPGGVLLCGPFKEGDHSNVRTVGSATEGQTTWYEEHPYGSCSQLLPLGSTPTPSPSTFLRRGWGGLIPIDDLPPYDPLRMGEETWERVMYKDNWTRLLYLFSYASFHASKAAPPAALSSSSSSAERALVAEYSAMLSLAHDLSCEVLLHEPLLASQALMGLYEYRSLGVVFGMWAKHLLDGDDPKPEQSAAASRKLLYSWSLFNKLSPGDPEIWPLVRDRVNPYTQAKIVGVEQDPLLAEFVRTSEAVNVAVAASLKKQAQAKKQKSP